MTMKEEDKKNKAQEIKAQNEDRGKPPHGRREDGEEKKEARKEASEAVAAPQVEVVEFFEKIISIKRVTKVTKGGKKLSFSALVVVGDTKGRVGYCLGKGGEVAIAIRKALVRAKKTMMKVPLKGKTIPHEIIGECGGAVVLLKPASEGTGVIAAGPVRAVCDGAGIHDILTKCHRSNNPTNVVKATIDGLSRLKSVSAKRKKELEILNT